MSGRAHDRRIWSLTGNQVRLLRKVRNETGIDPRGSYIPITSNSDPWLLEENGYVTIIEERREWADPKYGPSAASDYFMRLTDKGAAAL